MGVVSMMKITNEMQRFLIAYQSKNQYNYVYQGY